MLLGHFAISGLLHRYLNIDLKPVVLGGIFPDILDKTLCQGLRITPSGRLAAHNLLSLGITTLIVGLLKTPSAALAWGLGYLGHLVADSAGFVPWFYPFTSYTFRRSSGSLLPSIKQVFTEPKWLEWTLLVWALWVFTLGRRAK